MTTASHRVELPDGSVFSCQPGETVLRAALRAGFDAPYECASGACGSCKCRLKGGEVSQLWAEAPGLSPRDRRKGDRILTCQSVPSSDLVVDLRAGRPRVEPAPAPLLATVEVKTWLNATVIRLVLRLPEPARFLPGQFHLFELPGAGRRAYSMANLPNEDGRLEFLIKYKPGGAASKVLFEELAPGAQVLVEGPYGRGYLRPDPDRPLVAVAGGSGLAPMLSVVRGSRAGAASRSVTLYFGVNGPDELFCSHELEALLDDGVEVRWVLREGVHPTRAESVNGLVGDAMIAGEPTLSRKDLYLAGPAPMVEDVLRRTVRAGLISADRVFFDRFQ